MTYDKDTESVKYKISYMKNDDDCSSVEIQTEKYEEFIERLKNLAGITNINVEKEVDKNIKLSDNETLTFHEKVGLHSNDMEKLFQLMKKTGIFEPELEDLAIRSGITNCKSKRNRCDCSQCKNSHHCSCENECSCGNECSCENEYSYGNEEKNICYDCLAGNCSYHKQEDFKPISFNPIDLLNDRMDTMLNPALYEWLLEKSKILKNIEMDRWNTALEDFTRELVQKYGYDRKEAETIISYLVKNYNVLEEAFKENFSNIYNKQYGMFDRHYVGDVEKRYEKDLYNRYIQAKYGDNPLENKPADENDIWKRYENFIKNQDKD